MQPTAYMSESYVNLVGIDGKQHAQKEGTPPELDTSSEDDEEDQEPTFLDRLQKEKELARKNLENHHRRRPTMDEVEARGVVEQGYFKNMQVALSQKRERRKSFTTVLAAWFRERPDMAQMMAKGLVKAEYIGMDDAQAIRTEMMGKRKAIKSKLNQKLNKKRRPSVQDLEQRGIVPTGYFSDAVECRYCISICDIFMCYVYE